MRDNKITIPIAYAFVADTCGTYIIATAGVIVLATIILLSQRLSQTCSSIGPNTCIVQKFSSINDFI